MARRCLRIICDALMVGGGLLALLIFGIALYIIAAALGMDVGFPPPERLH